MEIKTPEFQTHSKPNDGWDYARIWAFDVDPLVPTRMFVTNGKTIMRTLDGGCTWKAVYDVFEEAPQPDEAGQEARVDSIVVTPGTKRVYVLLYGVQGASPLRVSSDDGDNWTTPTSGLIPLSGGDHSMLRVAPSRIDTVYVVLRNPELLDELFVSNDGGQSWESRGTLPMVDQSASGATTLLSQRFSFSVDPLDAQSLWGQDGYGLLESHDGGKTWRRNKQLNPKAVDVVAGKDGSSTIGALQLVNGDTQVSMSPDGGKSWKAMQAPPDVRYFSFGRSYKNAVVMNDTQENYHLYRLDYRSQVWVEITPNVDLQTSPAALSSRQVDVDLARRPSVYLAYKGAIMKYVGRW